ncbi:MAG: inositol monophosphatase family protein [Paracoccus sp. (in: a-proteobacteria)]|uniref:inositol monophosphatase family protein n=1 Tax=Paracoccus sp. TaxID=267 RepID=UPI003242399A
MMASANLNVMVKAARKAGRGLVKDFREVENLQVSVKGAGDFVTRADREAERQIKEELQNARPSYGWLGQETGREDGEDPTRRWIVDPLDGTSNFLHGLPHWGVSIALEHKGEIVAAVIFDAAKDELFIAEKGGGAFMNDQRLRVSGRTRMADSVFATGIPHASSGPLPASLQDLARLMPVAGGVRSFGAPSLNLCYVAAGRFDGYWDRGTKSWEVAAGILMVREAGGFVEGIRDGDSPLESGRIIAANPTLLEPFAKVVRSRD